MSPFSLLIKKQPFIIVLPKKQRIYDYFYEFASEALHIAIFENWFLRKRAMASNPKTEYQVFLCVFQKNSAIRLHTLGWKETGRFTGLYSKEKLSNT